MSSSSGWPGRWRWWPRSCSSRHPGRRERTRADVGGVAGRDLDARPPRAHGCRHSGGLRRPRAKTQGTRMGEPRTTGAACPARRGTGARHRIPGRGAAVRGSRGGPSSRTPSPTRRRQPSGPSPLAKPRQFAQRRRWNAVAGLVDHRTIRLPLLAPLSSGPGNRSARIHTSCAVVSAPTLDRALAR